MDRLGRVVRSTGLIAPLVLGLAGCATGVRRVPSPTDSARALLRLNGISAEYTRFLQDNRPEVAARASNFITELPDPSLDQRKREAQFARAALIELDQVTVDALAEDDYVSWLALRWEMEAVAGWAAFHRTDLSHLAPGSSIFDRSVSILNSQSVRDSGGGARFRILVPKVGDRARVLREEYGERATRGIRLPRAVAARAIAHIRSFIAPATSSLFVPGRELSSSDTARGFAQASDFSDVIEKYINPSLDSLAALLERERDRSTDSLGLVRLPGGDTHYATLLRYHSTLDVTPDVAHGIGLREVARMAAKAAAARDAARLPVNRDSLRAALRRDSAFSFDERSSIPERTAQLFERSARALLPLFGPVPGMALTIGVMRDVSDASPLASYDLPTLNRPASRYLVNIEELITRSALVMPGLVTGDLMPGLHLQQGRQFDNADLPAFRRLAFHDGFVRGWQIYALDVTDSLSTDLEPWERFGLRMRELAAACGLVVDTGINALGWSRSEALAFLRAYLPDDDDDLDREFIYPASERPGVLSAATLGAREFRGLRRWAQRESGNRFSLPAFHAEILRVGSIPLPVLGTHLERWIWDLNHPPPPPPPPTARR